jgi:tetratricopeptide (TPR) repeat protein
MATVILSALLAMAVPAAGQPQNPRTTGAEVAQYREIVGAYRNGRIMEAIREIETLPSGVLSDDLKATAAAYRRNPQLLAPGIDERFLRAAALLHTDTAAHLWPTSRPQALKHLDIARFWADEVGTLFRPRWYLAAGLLLVNLGVEKRGVNEAIEFFDRACVAVPGDAPLLIASAWLNERTALAPGTWDQMPRDWVISGVIRGKRMYLEEAARRLTAALAADPSATEAALRLGRVRMLLGDTAKAQSVLSDVMNRPGILPAQAYLARLLLGRAREQAGDAAGAESLYRAAALLVPAAQSARMALADRRYASGDPPDAADAIESVLAAGADRDVRDPWNDYLIDHLARGEALLVALRGEARQ